MSTDCTSQEVPVGMVVQVVVEEEEEEEGVKSPFTLIYLEFIYLCIYFYFFISATWLC